MFGDDFNFFIATNVSIDLYKIKLDKKESKLVKNIVLPMNADPSLQVYYEPMANLVVVADNKGACSPFFLNLYKQKQHRGKVFNLETSPEGGADGAGDASSSRASLGERAMSFFKKA